MIQRIALAAGLLAAAACTKPENRVSSRIDPALAVLIPDGAKYIMGVKLDKLRDSVVYQRHIKDRFGAQFDEFARSTGLDPNKDLWEIVICSDGKRNVMLGRGKFPVSDLEPRLDQEGVPRYRYKTFNFYGDDQRGATFVNVSTAVVGATEWLKEIVDRQNKPGLPAALEPLIESIPPGTQVFALFEGLPWEIPTEKEDSNLANLARVAHSIQNGWMSLHLNSGMNLNLVLNCKNAELAEGLHGAARGVLGFARLSTPSSQPQLLKAIDTVDIRLEQSRVRISSNMTENVVEDLINTALGKRIFRDR